MVIWYEYSQVLLILSFSLLSVWCFSFYLVICPKSFAFMASKNVFCGLHHKAGARTRVHLVASQENQGSKPWLSHKSLFGPALPSHATLRGIFHKEAQPMVGLCCLNLPCFLILEKSHSSSACLVSQISRFLAGGISQSYGKQEPHILTICATKVFAFSILCVCVCLCLSHRRQISLSPY